MGIDASPIVAYGFGDGPLHLRGRRPHRAGTLTDELQGGNDVSLEENEILIRPEEGAYLPVLDIMHKVTAGASGGSVKIEEWGLPPGEMIPPTPMPARTSARSF
jgi:hypothetical protein